jgi:hypothetical protein
VVDDLGAVAVAGFPDVVALLSVLLVSTPTFFQHFGDVPLGDTLFNTTSQNLSRGLTPTTRLFQLNALAYSD